MPFDYDEEEMNNWRFAEELREMQRIAESFPQDSTWQIAVDFVGRYSEVK